jgi:hypothetical protein
MDVLASRYQDNFLKGDIRQYRRRVEKLAGYFGTPFAIANRAVLALRIGLVRAAVRRARRGWSEDPAGEPLLILPVCHGRGCVELVAFDQADPDRFFCHGRGTAVIGEAALFAARSSGAISLYETPLAWLRAWCADCACQEALAAHVAGPAARSLSGFDRSMAAPQFDGVCLLDPAAPLLPEFTGIAKIHCENLAFARALSAKIIAEIQTAPRPKYPAITSQSPERETAE